LVSVSWPFLLEEIKFNYNQNLQTLRFLSELQTKITIELKIFDKLIIKLSSYLVIMTKKLLRSLLCLLFFSLSVKLAKAKVIINELYPAPNTGEKEWVELLCIDQEADLTNWTLWDELSSPGIIFNFTDQVLEPNDFLILELSSKLNNSADGVVLKNDKEEIIDRFDYDNSTTGLSWSRDLDDSWFLGDSTKAKPNVIPLPSPTLTPAPTPSPSPTSQILHPTSCIPSPTSYIPTPTSYILATSLHLATSSARLNQAGEFVFLAQSPVKKGVIFVIIGSLIFFTLAGFNLLYVAKVQT
jgi:hypothetical protein